MDAHRAVGRGSHLDQRFQDFVIDLDPSQRPAGDLFALRHHTGQHVADTAGFLAFGHQHGPVFDVDALIALSRSSRAVKIRITPGNCSAADTSMFRTSARGCSLNFKAP